MKRTLLMLIILFSVLINKSSFSVTLVKVGGYTFPPYINSHNVNEKQNGLTFELIKELNNIQKEFKFEFVPTASSRRYIDYKKNSFDFIFFEDISWGWKDYDVVASRLIVKDEEIYIAKNKDGRDESYFEDKKNKKFVGIKGYHYAFANFNSDVDFLKKNLWCRTYIGS